jgi:hypothetical protein
MAALCPEKLTSGFVAEGDNKKEDRIRQRSFFVQ